ncbi:MAG: fumarylacetoacetate hydrolase family protein [Vicinamibacterales bacterium]
MRYLSFSLAGDARPRLGAFRDNQVIDLAQAGLAAGLAVPDSLLALVQAGPDVWRAVAALAGGTVGSGASHAPEAVRWHAPIPRPAKNIFCLGLNYASHAVESAHARGRQAKIPTTPVFFTKAPTTVNGPYDDIPVDGTLTQQVDWEAELGVIIGRTGRNIARTDAAAHVFGYTVVNDFTARDLQAAHLQWFKGKSLDGSCPMGPWVVTADEFGDPQAKAIALRVNGTVKQSATTADMIFPVDVILETLSRGLTLEAGDIISTGTPEGVGMGRTPQEFLHDGDVVETEVEGIGVLRNRIVVSG